MIIKEKFIEYIINEFSKEKKNTFITLTYRKEKSPKECIDLLYKFIRSIRYLQKTENLVYFYGYELHRDKTIHSHLIINCQLSDKDKTSLLKKWNEYNNFEWYNNFSIDFQEIVENNKTLNENVIDIIKYMLKIINNIEEYLEIYYIFEKKFIFGSSKNLIKCVKELEEYINKKCENYLNISEEKKSFNITIKEYINKIIVPEFLKEHRPSLYNILNKIEENVDLENKIELQNEIEEFIYNENFQTDINLNKFYELRNMKMNNIFKSMKKKITELIKESYLLKNKNENLLIIQSIMPIDLWIVIYFESLVSYLKPKRKKIIKDLKDEELDEEILKNIWSNVTIENNFLICKLICSLNYNFYRKIIESKDLTLNEELNEYILKESELNIENINLIKEIKNIWQNKKELIYKSEYPIIDTNIFTMISNILIDASIECNILENKLIEYKTVKGQILPMILWQINEDLLSYFINELTIMNIQLPFVIEPKDYYIIKEGIYQGGYHIEKLRNKYNIFINESYIIKPYIEQETINYINSWQKQPVRIDKDYLDYLMNLNEETISYWTEGKIKLSSLLNNKISKTKKDIEDETLAKQFLLSIYIADKYKDYDEIWFLWKLDARLRMLSIGSPLNFQGNKILRPLFQSCNKFINRNIKNINNINNAKIFINILKTLKENYNKKAFLMNPRYSWCELDAKAQSFQILGGLIGNKKLLKLVFVLKNEEKIDIYNYFLKKLEIELNKEEIKDYISNEVKYYLNTIIKPYYTMKRYNIENIMNYIYKKFLERDFIKRVLMFKSYNKSTRQTIMDENEKIFYLEYKSFNKLYNITSLIIKKLLNLLDEEFPEIINLKKIFTILGSIGVLLKKGNYMCFSDNLNIIGNTRSFLQQYPELKINKVQNWVFLKDKNTGKVGKNLSTYFYEAVKDENNEIILDLKKNQIALLPNSTHHLDADILFNTISNLLNKNIPILAIHDAYYTTIDHIYEVKLEYISNYKNILKLRPLFNYIKNSFYYWNISNLDFNNIYHLLKIEFKEDGVILYKVLDKNDKKNLSDLQKNLYKYIIELLNNYEIILLNSCNLYELLKELEENPNLLIIN